MQAMPLNIVTSKLSENNINFTSYPNFIVFSYEFTYTIFKVSKNSKMNHINVTKIKRKRDIKKAKSTLISILGKKILSVKIDNIIATTDLKRKVDLQKVSKFKLCNIVKYNPECFPGLFAKFERGTVIIFHSGKIVILGTKRKQEIRDILAELVKNFIFQNVL